MTFSTINNHKPLTISAQSRSLLLAGILTPASRFSESCAAGQTNQLRSAGPSRAATSARALAAEHTVPDLRPGPRQLDGGQQYRHSHYGNITIILIVVRHRVGRQRHSLLRLDGLGSTATAAAHNTERRQRCPTDAARRRLRRAAQRLDHDALHGGQHAGHHAARRPLAGRARSVARARFDPFDTDATARSDCRLLHGHHCVLCARLGARLAEAEEATHGERETLPHADAAARVHHIPALLDTARRAVGRAARGPLQSFAVAGVHFGRRPRHDDDNEHDLVLMRPDRGARGVCIKGKNDDEERGFECLGRGANKKVKHYIL